VATSLFYFWVLYTTLVSVTLECDPLTEFSTVTLRCCLWTVPWLIVTVAAVPALLFEGKYAFVLLSIAAQLCYIFLNNWPHTYTNMQLFLAGRSELALLSSLEPTRITTGLAILCGGESAACLFELLVYGSRQTAKTKTD
jgi:hypothetical protein